MPRYRANLTAQAMVRASVAVAAADRASAGATAASEPGSQGIVWDYVRLDDR
jgi:hypothetical protein